MRFGITRSGVPLKDYPLRHSVNSGVRYSLLYAEMEAAIAAGATLTELQEWLEGHTFTVRFKERVVAWNNMRHLIAAHREEAAAQKRGK